MTTVLDETFEKRMQQAESDIVREFDSMDRDLVHEHFERVSSSLLQEARVTDFVPVLTRRHVRDILREIPATTAANS